MILLLGSQKGGCGKSTLATNIAAALAHKSDVFLLDTDTQGTSSTWVQDRESQDVPAVQCVQRFGDIRNTVKDLAGRYDHVVIDAIGRDSTELRTGLIVADVVLCPFRPSQADVDTAKHLAEVVDQAKDLNAGMRILGVLTLCPTNPRIKEVRDARAYLKDFSIPIAKPVVYDRKVYRDALSEGLGVIESKNPKAKQEIHDLVKVIYGKKAK